jgi:hypothetical protein
MVYHTGGVDQPSCCGAVPGITILGTVVPLTATGTRPRIKTIPLVFGSSVFLPALFSARVDGWEFIERAEEESRSAPVMLETVSKNQTEPDGLVGSPKTHPVHLALATKKIALNRPFPTLVIQKFSGDRILSTCPFKVRGCFE